jgi:ABC-type multidrug transport system fused ATPase/permease subunit
MLKVMMGQEGLHSWADRKICDWRYGISFYVPEFADFGDGDDLDTVKYLLITHVDEDELAAESDLRFEDKITALSSTNVDQTTTITGRGKMLAILSQTPDNSVIKLDIKRSDDNGNSYDTKITFSTGNSPKNKKTVIEITRWAIGLVPKIEGRSGKKLAVIAIIIFMGIITIIRCIARFIQQYIGSKVVQVSIAQLREDAFAHAMEMPVGFFVKEGTSDTISRLIGDINGTGAGIKVMLGKALREPAKAIACLAMAMMISWKLVLIFLCCAPFTIGFAAILGKKMKKYTKRSLASSALMLGRLRGAINALRVVKVYNRQDYESNSYHRINRNFLKQVLRAAKVQAATGPIMEVIGMFAGSAALLVGVHWMTQESNPMDSPAFFGLLILLGTSAESIRKASDVINKVQKANAAAERVFAVIDCPVEEEKPDAIELEPLKYNIEFRDIAFTYPGCEEPILKGVNLSVQAGHNIAVVGPNGSGKTTLVNLIPRFYNADSGAILIDGQDIRNATLKSLRDQIAMVTQNVVTFNDTIAANIAYGRPDATMDEIIDAARRSFAHEFIEPLPDGYNSVIGEDGAGLSGGQLQRIVIARAILKNPPILIFDEATSQVDAKSESKIHSAIEEIMKDRTSFVIAHRFSTVISADTIVVMDEGRIAAQGSHAELMKDCKLYQGLYETQLLVPEDE